MFDDIKDKYKTSFTSHYQYFNIGISEDLDSILVRILNKGIKSMDSDFVDQVISRNTDYGTPPFSIPRVAYQYPALTILIFPKLSVRRFTGLWECWKSPGAV